MKIKIKNELILLDVLVLALIVSISFLPYTMLRIILGLPFLFFIPGYVLITAMFARRDGISTTERLALSCGTSIALVALIGLILSFSSLGIKLGTILYSVSAFIIVTSGIAWWRRRHIPQQLQFRVEFEFAWPDWRVGWNRSLSVILVVSVLGMAGMIAYLIAVPKAEKEFTEFYVLGPDGEAANFRRELTLNDTEQVIIGMVNREQRDMRYYLEVMISGTMSKEMGPIILKDKQKWEQPVTLQFSNVGNNQEADFLLLKEGEKQAYRVLHIWYDIKEK